MRLPFTFIFTGIVGFVLFHALSLITFAKWLELAPRSADGLFRVHLLILGWASITAMGAVYQLISVVLQSKIYSERLGYVHYALMVIGVIGLLVGFQSGRVYFIAGFATITLFGMLCFVWNILCTLLRAAMWNPVTVSVTCSLVCLTLAGALGMAMGLNFAFGGLGIWHERLFAAHIWLGAVGWFGFLIIGFSLKLLPMFYLSHKYPTQLQHIILWLWGIGTAVGLITFLNGSPLMWKGIAFVLLTSAALLYNVHMMQIRKHRHKKTPGSGIKWAIISAQMLTLLGIGICTVIFAFQKYAFIEKMVVLACWGYLWGWVAMTILGYLSKIAPFLWWTHKYGPQVGKKKVPSMGDLISERWTNIGLGLIAISLLVLMIGIGFDLGAVIRLSAGALSLFSLIYMSFIARVFTQ